MGKKVFANGMEIAHKAGDGKVIAAFPDVCLSPPSPPAGPVPIPYPNTSMASDLQSGSKKVMIGGKPLALKGQSYFATSPLGDEAATRSFGGGVVSHSITGKTYFQAASMDVTVEGKAVCRHLDITTSNHASEPGNESVPLPEAESQAPGLAGKKDAKWGHKRGVTRHDCRGNHSWECNKAECPDCWQPPCEPNAQETQKNYNESQSGTPQERAAKGKAAHQKKADKGDAGAALESKAVDKVGHSSIEHVGYKAHCSQCHMIADIDVVTSDDVIEVKLSAKALDLDQMKTRVSPVAKKCFPGKRLKIATRASEEAKMKSKLREAEWSSAFPGMEVIPI
jgi:uncharacterized Zn-binding protein involved in type VI secretion